LGFGYWNFNAGFLYHLLYHLREVFDL